MTAWVDAVCTCCQGTAKAIASETHPMGSSHTRVKCDGCRRSCHPRQPCRLAEQLARA